MWPEHCGRNRPGGGCSAPCSSCGARLSFGAFPPLKTPARGWRWESDSGPPRGSPVPQSFTGSALAALVKGLPEALQRQFEYEDPVVRGGKQLLHSPFFKVTWAQPKVLGTGGAPSGTGQGCRSGPQKLPNRAATHARPVRAGLLCDAGVRATRIAGGWAGTGHAAGHGKALAGHGARGAWSGLGSPRTRPGGKDSP